MTEQQTLVEFLEERLQDDEDAARAAGGQSWQQDATESTRITDQDGENVTADDMWLTDQQAAHVAIHDPARVLREVAAKRAIIELADEASGLDQSVDLDRRVGTRDMEEEPFVGDLILRQLAAVYSDHEAYREEWRP